MTLASLLYHDVLIGDDPHASGFPGAGAAIYKLARADFEAHLTALREAGAAAPVRLGRDAAAGVPNTSAAPGEASAGMAPATADARDSGRSSDLAFALTFDDGGVSAHEVIAPALERHGWHGHFFVTTDFLGSPAFLGREHVRELHDRGHVIGSHSCSHPQRMAALRAHELDDEWARSVDTLSDLVGDQVRTASVPNGFYAKSVARAAARAGVRWLFTSEPTTRVEDVDGCVVLGRFNVLARTPATAVADMVSIASRTRRKQQLHWAAKKVVKRVGGSAYLSIRERLLRRR